MTGLTAAAPATRSTEQEAEAQYAHVALLRMAYQRWNDSKGADADSWSDILANDMKFGSLAGGAAHLINASNSTGKEAMRAFFTMVPKSWLLLSFSVDEFVAQGDTVVMRGRISWQNKRTGKVFSSPKFDYWRFKNGQVVEYFEACDTAGIQAAASG